MGHKINSSYSVCATNGRTENNSQNKLFIDHTRTEVLAVTFAEKVCILAEINNSLSLSKLRHTVVNEL